ncbi:MAG TPA: DUF1036 domain-containing protein [Rhizomicrobium sp.]|jgi:uncharacterized membrane protein|nr:DUF1036 domain-containing protein [Rhizomicrobium sp.]
MKWALPAVVLAAGLMPKPAHAALTLCNRTSYVLYAATSAIQSPKSETQGWTRIAPGDCQIARKEPLQAANYLVYARSGIAHSGPSRAWGGAYPVCVKDTDFSIKQAVTPLYCAADDTFALPFAALDNRGKSVWTMNFDEKPAMTLTEAQLAGVKRLLKDNGYPIARIDGKPDKATGTALADFRTKMKFSPNAGNAELFQALEQQARQKIAPSGYTVCNDSRDVLLVALGEIARGRPVSRGWWTVQPGACAKTVTAPLKTDAVYLLARKKGGGTVVAGAKAFCTTPVIFEISGAQNCAGRGLAEAGFAMTATKGVTGYIARIGADGLVR